MREECVDAGESLGGINLIEFVFVSAVLYFYGQKPMPREVFEGNSRRSVEHANPQHDVIHDVGECDKQKDREQDTPCDLFATHAGSIAEAVRLLAVRFRDFTGYRFIYCFISTGVPIL